MKSTKLPSWIEALLGLAPVPVPPHVFSLSPEGLGYARFERAGRRLELRELRSLPLAPNTFQPGLLGGPLADAAAFRAEVKRFVAGISVPVKSASLVLPDAWLRVAFAESEELPKASNGRGDVLRWKLKRLVPFRVDELRIEAVPVTPLANQVEPRRLMMAFAIELLLSQLEGIFAAQGVRLGQITSASLALVGAMDDGASDGRYSGDSQDGLTALALVDFNGYTLAFDRGGEPALHRFKAMGARIPESARAALVGRDLRLTRNFLDQQFPGVPLERALLAAPAALEPAWMDWLSDGLGCPVEAVHERHLPLAQSQALGSQGPGSGPLAEAGLFSSWSQLAPLVGAASQEVA